MNSTHLRIALVRLSALGDIVNTAVALQIIKKHYPDSTIDWYVEEAFEPLLKGHPLLHKTIPIPLKRIKKTRDLTLLKQLIRTLKSQEPYDIVIDVQGLLKSALVSFFIPGKKHGFDRKSIRESIASWFYTSTSSIPYTENIVRRNIKVITDALHLTFEESEIISKKPVFPCQDSQNIPAIALVIGASWPSKCYPKEKFAQLCKLLPLPCTLIWGSQKEHEDAVWIANNTSNATIAPQMDLKALTCYLAQCKLIIGNDTGPTHMGWAMNTPSITLFGPTNERMIYATSSNVGIHSPSEVNILKINREDFSINQIDPYVIAEKAKELL